MATFTYEAIHEPGAVIKGEIEAEDASAATTLLLTRGYHVLTVQNTDEPAGHAYRIGLGFGRTLKKRDLVRYTRDLANLVKAGFPLSEALNTIRSQTRDKAWRAVWGGVRSRIEDGQTFSHALEAYPGIFDAVFTNLIHSGEESGKLPDVLSRLVLLGEKREDIRSRFRMALVYPAAMLCVGFITVLVMMTFVVPMFVDVFKETGQTLPAPTRILVFASNLLGHGWYIIAPVFIGAALGISHFARTARGRELLGLAGLRLPLINRLIRQSETAAFSRTLSTLLNSGVPIVSALNITAATLKNMQYQQIVHMMSVAVREGESLAAILARQRLFPPMVGNVVAVGERTGDLSGALNQVADENEQELDREVKIVMTLLEPVMIVLMGAVVGFIVLAMLLPIFSLGDIIQV